MTISFSGLASGIDTSTWVEALTSLKRAKITTLQEKQESISIQKDALANIKSYFNTFRTTIEKITDSKFGVDSMDLFSQNLAISSNASKLTATATNIAEDNTYNISVSQLATGTKAESTYTSVVASTTVAAGTSKLQSLNLDGATINSGDIYVTVDGITRGISVSTNETIDSFINKLHEVGVDASYNYETGKLSMNISISDIDDGTTNIKSAFHLTGVNEGYQSNKLEYKNTVTHSAVATQATRIVDLGFGITLDNADSNGEESVLVRNSSGNDYLIKIGETTTLGDFISDLNDAGLHATLSNDGELQISGGSIIGGSFDSSVFGFSGNVDGAFATGNAVNATLAVANVIDLQTRLVEDIGMTRGYFEITAPDNSKHYEKVYAGMTVSDLISDLSNLGISVSMDSENGIISLSGGSLRGLTDSEVMTLCNNATIVEPDANLKKASNFVSSLGYTSGTQLDFKNAYTNNGLDIPGPVIGAMTADTKLSDLVSDEAFKAGMITIVKNGVQFNLEVSGDDTVGRLMEMLSMHDFDSVLSKNGELIIQTTGNSRLQAYTANPSAASNLLDILGLNSSDWINSQSYLSNTLETKSREDTFITANEDTMLSDLARISVTNENGIITSSSTVNDSFISNLNGNIELTIDGIKNTIEVSTDETVGSLLNKFRTLGLEANIMDGKITLHSGYSTLSMSTPGVNGSSIITSGLLSYNSDMGGYVSSSESVMSTTFSDEEFSAVSWADNATKLSLLNITEGTFSVYRDGIKASVTIEADDTFASLQDKINSDLTAKYGSSYGDIQFQFEDGYLSISSASGASVTSGASTDSSNFSSITGIFTDNDNVVRSSAELFKVNSLSKITTSGLFRIGDITEGSFVIGDKTITIDSSTTMSDIVNTINSSEECGANAYWDSVKGKLVITSRNSGSMFVNIESGTSNFTDVMGFTATERDGSNNIISTSMNVESQKLGGNAVFYINGTAYTSNSNTINSDISRIEGVTINLRDVTVGEDVTLKIQKDSDSLSTAMEDVVGAYNQLMTAVDDAIDAEGTLSGQTTLKAIRNQLRSYMTSSISSSSVFKNLDAIGISVGTAAAGNISTSNSSVNLLTLDKEKFKNAYASDPNSVKLICVGDSTSGGILSRVEDLLENTLQGVSGYFDTQTASFNKQMTTITNQISKVNQEVLRYQNRLQAKFSAMDMLISGMQQQYSSFMQS